MIRAILDGVSLWAIPVLLVGIPLVGMIRKVKVYDVFIEGAKEGFNVAIRIIPFLVGILVAIGMFRGSGAMDLLTGALKPLMAATGFPAESCSGYAPTWRGHRSTYSWSPCCGCGRTRFRSRCGRYCWPCRTGSPRTPQSFPQAC